MNLITIKGVGKHKEKLLNKLDIKTVEDLIYDFPHRYVDRTNVINDCMSLPNGNCTFKAELIDKRAIRSNLYLTVVSGLTEIKIIFMHCAFMIRQFEIAEKYYFSGNINDGTMFNPDFALASDDSFIGMYPVYRLTKGISNKEAKRIHFEALKSLKANPEITKEPGFIADLSLIFSLHNPSSLDEVYYSRRRFVLGELVNIRLNILKSVKLKATKAINVKINHEKILPFDLTKSQLEVLNEIENDLNSEYVMNRIVQGDVGSGKSVVAYLAAEAVAKSGGQVLIMAPTSILARQLHEGYISNFGNAELLMSSLNNKEKIKIKERISSGKAAILFGTHAVIQDDVNFRNLMLVITDEQQRFGLIQRQTAIGKAIVPHSLYLTATPIPRTMAMCFYGDMDQSVINHLPMGRKKTKTKFVDKSKAVSMLKFIQKEINSGRQVYFVVPDIQKSILAVHSRLKKRLNANIAIIHGQMKPEEIEDIMEKFRNHKIDILVSTTIIEVGVDVPNATIMVIMEADKFGLSQLHQLRGRVGRGFEQSYCFLMSPRGINERLKIIEESADGSFIAQKDLEIRGPGSFLGSEQSGKLKLKFDFTVDDIKLADKIAKFCVENKISSNIQINKIIEEYVNENNFRGI